MKKIKNNTNQNTDYDDEELTRTVILVFKTEKNKYIYN